MAVSRVVVALMALVVPLEASAQFGRDAVESRVVALAERDASGAEPLGTVESGRLSQGQQVQRAYRLQAGTCYWFVGTGDGNIHDLDLLVRVRGVVVVRDQSTTRDVVVPGERPYCPSEEQRVQVRVVAFRGGGMYATAVYQQEGNAAAATPAGINVTELLDRAAVRYAPGMGQAAVPTLSRMANCDDMTVEQQLEGGMCYRFIAVGGDGVRDLGLQIFQGSSELDADEATASEAVASYCATATTTVRIRLRMLRGSGEIALAPYAGGARHVSRRRPDSGPAVAVGGEGDDYLARQLRAHHSRAGQGRSGVSEVFRANLRTSQDQSFPVRLEGGRCYTFIAVGSPSIRDLDLYYIDTSGMERQHDTGPESHAIISTDPCPRWTGTYSIRVRARAGYGPIAVQAFGN